MVYYLSGGPLPVFYRAGLEGFNGGTNLEEKAFMSGKCPLSKVFNGTVV